MARSSVQHHVRVADQRQIENAPLLLGAARPAHPHAGRSARRATRTGLSEPSRISISPGRRDGHQLEDRISRIAGPDATSGGKHAGRVGSARTDQQMSDGELDRHDRANATSRGASAAVVGEDERRCRASSPAHLRSIAAPSSHQREDEAVQLFSADRLHRGGGQARLGGDRLERAHGCRRRAGRRCRRRARRLRARHCRRRSRCPGATGASPASDSRRCDGLSASMKMKSNGPSQRGKRVACRADDHLDLVRDPGALRNCPARPRHDADRSRSVTSRPSSGRARARQMVE